MLAEHRVESNQFEDVDGLQSEFRSGPLNRFLRQISEVFLQCVQKHQRRTSLHWIMGDKLVNFGLKRRRNREWATLRRADFHGICRHRRAHRSHSPITKSKEPRMATVSLIMCPGSKRDKMLRFTNEGARIFSRC